MSKKHRSTKQDKRKHTRDEIENIIKDDRIKDLFNKIIEKNSSDKYSEEKSKKHVKEFYKEEYDEEKTEKCSEEKSKKHKKHRRHRKEKEFTTCYDRKQKKENCLERNIKNDKKENSSKHEIIEVEEFIEERFEKRVEEDCTEDRHDEHNKQDKQHKHGECDDDWTDEDDNITVECCEADVDSEILSLCPNTELPVTAAQRKVVIKTPVVLAEPRITISMVSSLKLEEPALEIKRIRKNVYLTQCKLIPNSGGEDTNYGVIFIEGFIKKNIEYATAECKDEGVVSGKIKHTTVKVPFKCTTRVKFTTQPIFTNNTPQNEIEIVQSTFNLCDPCGESIFGINPCEQSSRFTEFFNEKVFCELVDTEILESDILQKPTGSCCNSPIEQSFQNITEKVVLNVTIKLLQNQQVLIG